MEDSHPRRIKEYKSNSIGRKTSLLSRPKTDYSLGGKIYEKSFKLDFFRNKEREKSVKLNVNKFYRKKSMKNIQIYEHCIPLLRKLSDIPVKCSILSHKNSEKNVRKSKNQFTLLAT